MKCPWESLSTKDKIIRVVMDFIADEGFKTLPPGKLPPGRALMWPPLTIISALKMH